MTEAKKPPGPGRVVVSSILFGALTTVGFVLGKSAELFGMYVAKKGEAKGEGHHIVKGAATAGILGLAASITGFFSLYFGWDAAKQSGMLDKFIKTVDWAESSSKDKPIIGAVTNFIFNLKPVTNLLGWVRQENESAKAARTPE